MEATWDSTRITTATTTPISTTAAVLGGIWFEGGTLGKVEVYDGTAAAGTKVSEVTPADLTVLPKNGLMCPRPGRGCGDGIYVVTAAATHLVVFWRSARSG
jgi:hypothetical protein